MIDSHCHAWATWPYQPPVPDPESRGRIEQLLFEMDQNGVARAIVICAGIDGNPDNNRYVYDAVKRFPGRLVPFADVDSRWLATHQTPGAAGRLRDAAEAFGLVGFTHYLRDEEDGAWLLSEEGDAFLRQATNANLILSLACTPRHMPVVETIAERYPLPILCHHMARVQADFPGRSGLEDIIAASRHTNVFIKLSGFGYAAPKEGFPYLDLAWVVRCLYEFYGPERLCWGSDYPVVRRFMTYAQSLDVARRHCAFMPEGERALVFGGTMARLLREREGA
jgi:predicted TIM-barrel fold metal-dependent hydrolase